MDKFQTLAPRKRFAEGSTENVIWRSLNVVRCCYPWPGVVTVIGVIPDNSVIEITFVGTYALSAGARAQGVCVLLFETFGSVGPTAS